MRTLMIVLAGAAFLTVSAYAADTQVDKTASNTTTKTLVASSDTKQVKKASKVVTKTQVQKAPEAEPYVRVWSVEMSCCEPQ